MPGTNLTRDEAATRAALLDVTSYVIDLDLSDATTPGVETFGSTTTLTFTCRTPGAETFADLVDATIREVTLNGVALDPAEVYADSRIALRDLQAENVLVVKADCAYSNSGEGLHHFTDPVDGNTYLYSQFEVPDARRVFTTFEQPDLKAPFTFNVTAPAHWKVVSNSPTPEPTATGATNAQGQDVALWAFAPTKPMSTYITAIVAGDYYEVQDVYEGEHGTIPLGHYCRQSLKEYLDRDREEIVTLTKQGFAFFEDAFGYPYPFGKYDQLYVPEYNMGAMENAGCVTLRDEYLPRSRQPRSFYEFRASVILHEMAHMWFGDLVTMKWWDDLWLNESFAEWACYHAEALATSYDDAWTGFTNARKQTGYRADSLPSTHPIAADNFDLHAVEVNFDMITYAKGAAVLKQLVAWVGLEPFLAGLRQYFTDHAFGNTEFSDLLAALEKASGRELDSWAAEWLQTAGTNTLTPELEVDDEGRYRSFAVRQTAPAEHPTLRRHRVGIGFYESSDDGRLRRTDYVEVDVTGERTEVAELVGKKQPELLLLNDSDLAFAKIRLDERSQATAIARLADLEDSLARALVWSAAWDMTRDAEMPATDFVELVLRNIGSETDAWGVSRIPTYAAQAVTSYSDPAGRAALAQRWEQGLRELLVAAEPGTDHQLTFARSYAAAARSDAAAEELEGLLAGTVSFDGLAVDQDLRWTLLTQLARLGRADDARIDAELATDDTNAGREKAAAARAAIPTAAAKERAWQQAMLDPSVPNETQRSVVLAFMQPGQEEVLAPYVETYLAEVAGTWERLGSHKASVALEFIFPRVLATESTLQAVDAWLAEHAESVNPGAVRYVREGRADVARALAAQARDAQRG
ncbi:aminopeptidase N [Nocardioides sp. zg-536]|uniref:Aminopeptidase N n=1 Tax=Nocardioides faecalis TaxID=2803858 RepID=A0A938Y7N9_9ACTN|nr:aminopeptidase N [Nocardioides faecalis]MBM9460724.1 aminopeptidase N [Nocardioides faecalis]MBS4752663.1 aminopeptidase N [Nocardioides faecalis]QVI57927.1 aminopeptidase N [Nocardioides faecalis]